MRTRSKRLVIAIALVVAVSVAGCGKSNATAHHHGELTTAEKIDNLCFNLGAQLKSAYFRAGEGGPYAYNRSRQENLAIGEKRTLEQVAVKSAPVMLSIAREVRAVPVPSFVHPSITALVTKLEGGAAGYRRLATQVHGEPARPHELADTASAFAAPVRPAVAACRAAVLVLQRKHS